MDKLNIVPCLTPFAIGATSSVRQQNSPVFQFGKSCELAKQKKVCHRKSTPEIPDFLIELHAAATRYHKKTPACRGS